MPTAPWSRPPASPSLANTSGMGRPLYGQADLRVDQGDEPPEVVARRVIEALPSILRAPTAPPQGPIALVDGDGHGRTSFN